MSKFAVVVFPDERRASEGVRALQELHRDATLTVHGALVVRRDERGLSIGWRADVLPLGRGVRALAANLIALFGGPAHSLGIGCVCEGLVGGWRDDIHAGVSDEFLESIVYALVPGTFAIVAEMSEESVATVDARVGVLGGKVVRESREEFVDDLLENTANVRWAARGAQDGAGCGEDEAEIGAAVGGRRGEKLERAAAEIGQRIDYAREELEARVEALDEQAADASSEVRSRIDRRIAALREEFGVREERLDRAYRTGGGPPPERVHGPAASTAMTGRSGSRPSLAAGIHREETSYASGAVADHDHRAPGAGGSRCLPVL